MNLDQQKTYSPPADFELDQETRAWAEKHLPPDLLEDELDKFRAYPWRVNRHNWNFAARKWLQRAIDRHRATPDEPRSEDGREQRMMAYAKAGGPSNPKGNPHGIKLPDHIAARRPCELIEDYERRISAAITQSKYRR